MKKSIMLLALIALAGSSSAQLGKNLESKLSGNTQDPLNEYPKGMEPYSTQHSDEAGISGTYYAKFPIQFMYRTTMNTYKTFTVDQITLEFDPVKFAGRIHVVADAVTKLVRQPNTDLSVSFDFFGGGSGESAKQASILYSFYAFNVKSNLYMFGSIMGVNKKGSLVDGGQLFRLLEDKDIFLFGKPASDGKLYVDSQYEYGNNFNLFSKDKTKLDAWDSTKIATELFRHEALNKDYINKAMGSLVLLPKQALNDDKREAEYFAIIKEMAALDKPVAWADKFVYCYISSDWKEEFKSGVKTHRWCKVIAVSKGWTEGSDGRYIPVYMKQQWDGSAFGKTIGGPFEGSLVPVSSETIDSFAH